MPDELEDELELDDELELEVEDELELDEDDELLELELVGPGTVSPPQAVSPRAINNTLPYRSDCFFNE